MSKEQQDITAAQILQFAEDYSQKLEKLKKKQPYHLNIIEELHINENAHSRILAKLLQYKDKEGKYVFLESLLKYIKKKTGGKNSFFSKIQIKDPIITQEKKRIDLWVRTEKCAIIFENKVYNAKDQDAQISRYIAVNIKDYKEDSIYVVYLSSMGNEPDERTWVNENGKSLKKKFQNRYINISFKYDIISWLDESYKLFLQPKEKTLKAAIEQYIEYLRGLFVQGKEYEESRIFIINKLNLSNMNKVEKVESITNQIKEIETLKETLVQERVSGIKDCFRDYAVKIRKDFEKSIQSVNFDGVDTDRYPLCVKVSEKKPLVYIEVGDDGVVYCVIGNMREKPLLNKYNQRYKSDDAYESYRTFDVFNFKEIIEEFKGALKWVIEK